MRHLVFNDFWALNLSKGETDSKAFSLWYFITIYTVQITLTFNLFFILQDSYNI